MTSPKRGPETPRKGIPSSTGSWRRTALTPLLGALALAAAGCGTHEAEETSADVEAEDALTRGDLEFEVDDPGARYTREDAERDFRWGRKVTLWSMHDGDSITRGDALDAQGHSLRLQVPGGLENVGAKWRADAALDPDTTEATLSWRIYFEKDWVFRNGDTKLGGLGGGKYYTGGHGDLAIRHGDGWSARFILRRSEIHAYLYYAGMPGGSEPPVYGHHVHDARCAIEPEKWYTLRLSVKMNTGSKADGKIRMWVKGDDADSACSVYASDALQWKKVQGAGPSVVAFELFHGGFGDPPPTPGHVRYDAVRWDGYWRDRF